MKTQIEALQDNQVKLTVTVEAADVDARINKTYKDFAKKYRFPGFRPGKAPRPIIDNALGAQAVVATVTEELVNETYPLAVDAEDLFVVGRPEFTDEDLIVKEHEDLVYDVVVSVSPEFELSSYEPVEVKLPAEEATQKEIDDQLEQLREYYYDFKDAPANTKVKDGSFLDMNVKATDAEGAEIESLSAEGRIYEIGKGIFPAAFDAELMGLKKGEEQGVHRGHGRGAVHDGPGPGRQGGRGLVRRDRERPEEEGPAGGRRGSSPRRPSASRASRTSWTT